MAASRHKSLALLLCAGLVRDVFAQCVMPALEAGVEPGGATPCPAVGEDVLDTETCTVVCLAGSSQDNAGGTYEYVCTDTAFTTTPAPLCADCPLATYNEVPGQEVCDDCPANSNTVALGAATVTLCLCAAGYEGEIALPADTCDICGEATYREGLGPGTCVACPAEATTLATGSTLLTDCLCDVGYFGPIADPADTCTICPVDTYKDAPTAAAACDDCPADSITEAEGSVAVAACLCAPGFTGEVTAPDSECDGCAIGSYKEEPGPEDCIDCPLDADTEATGSLDISACRCSPGFGRGGPIELPADTCDACGVNTFKADSANEECVACSADEWTNGQIGQAVCTRQLSEISTELVVGGTVAVGVGIGVAFGAAMFLTGGAAGPTTAGVGAGLLSEAERTAI